MSKHTPGPWVAQDDGGGPYIMAGEWDIASAVGPFAYDDMELEANANARLIAAAPELLEALQRCAALLSRYPKHDDAWRQARAAIAKAEGENT